MIFYFITFYPLNRYNDDNVIFDDDEFTLKFGGKNKRTTNVLLPLESK